MKNNLSSEQIEFSCACVKKWLEICEQNGKSVGPKNAENSSLLRRLLSGKKAFDFVPPYRFGYPAWELLENDEIQIEELIDSPFGITIDKHDGYEWKDSEKKIILYRRLGLEFELKEKEIIPDRSCVDESFDPQEYKYTAKFLQRIIHKI